MSYRRSPRGALSRFLPASHLAKALLLSMAAIEVSSARAEPKPPGDESFESRFSAIRARPGGLTSDQVAKRAAETSYDAKASADAIRAAEASVSESQAAYWPKLTGTARYTRLSPITLPTISFGPSASATDTPGTSGTPNANGTAAGGASAASLFPVILNQYLLQAALTVPLSDYALRLSQALEASKRTKRGAEYDEKAKRAKSASDGRLGYYSWLKAQGELVVSEQAKTQNEGHVTDAKNGFEAGTASRADVLRAESQLKAAELQVLRSRNVVELTEVQLRLAMHDPSSPPYSVGEDVEGPMPPVTDAASVDALRNEALAKRWEVRALTEQAASQREQEKVTRAGMYPRLDAVGNAYYANPHPRVFPSTAEWRSSWDVGLQLTWTPTDIIATSARVAGASARGDQTESQADALRDAVRLEVTQAWQTYREAQAALETSAAGLLSAEESYRVRQDLYHNGRSTVVELFDAQTDLVRARREALSARVDLRSARVRLLHAVGRDSY